jgi:hypothetical protein
MNIPTHSLLRGLVQHDFRSYGFTRERKLQAARGAIRQQLASASFSSATAEVAFDFAKSAIASEGFASRAQWVLAWRYARLAARRIGWLVSEHGAARHFTDSLLRPQWERGVMRT